MEPKQPEDFYVAQFADDYGLYPISEVPSFEGWDLAHSLEFLMGAPPISIGVIRGYGAYIEHEDFWVVGKTPEELEWVVQEWPEED